MNGHRLLHVLLVEDNPADVLTLRELISDIQEVEIRLEQTERLSKAFAYLSQEGFDAVLLDLGLPDSQGLQTFFSLHARFPDMSVLVLTALGDETTGIQALQHGAQDYLVKGQFEGPLLGRSIRYSVERQHIAAKLYKSQVGLRRLATRLQDVREEERTRISREIHDELGQKLTGIRMDLRWLERRLNGNSFSESELAIRSRINETDKLVQSTIKTVQRLALELRPSVLDNLGLIEAIRDEARRFEMRTGIGFKMILSGDLPIPSNAVGTAFFRIFQELLTNIARHAEADNIEVSLDQDNDFLVLTVADNGRGFDPSVPNSQASLGLLGANERAHSFNGKIEIQSAPNRGTRIIVCMPFANPFN